MGISAAVPKKVFNNIEIYTDLESRKVINAIGVEKRRVASSGQTTSDLCYFAAKRLLEESDIRKEEVEYLIFLTQTPDYILPATSCILQHRLELSDNVAAFDINLGCSGYVYGLWIAYSLLSANNSEGYALVLTGDTSSITVNPEDPKTKYLFGDAGTATLVKGNKASDKTPFFLGTEGRNYDKLIIREPGFRALSSNDSKCNNDLQTYMDGTAVYLFTMRVVPPAVKKILELGNKNIVDIDYFIFHQANKMMLHHFTSKLKLPPHKVPTCLNSFGNTTSASIPLTIVSDDNLRKEISSKSQTLLLCGYGTGLSWGTCIVNTKNVCIPKLVEI